MVNHIENVSDSSAKPAVSTDDSLFNKTMDSASSLKIIEAKKSGDQTAVQSLPKVVIEDHFNSKCGPQGPVKPGADMPKCMGISHEQLQAELGNGFNWRDARDPKPHGPKPDGQVLPIEKLHPYHGPKPIYKKDGELDMVKYSKGKFGDEKVVEKLKLGDKEADKKGFKVTPEEKVAIEKKIDLLRKEEDQDKHGPAADRNKKVTAIEQEIKILESKENGTFIGPSDPRNFSPDQVAAMNKKRDMIEQEKLKEVRGGGKELIIGVPPYNPQYKL